MSYETPSVGFRNAKTRRIGLLSLLSLLPGLCSIH